MQSVVQTLLLLMEYTNRYLFGILGSTSSSLCEHWISRLMGSRPPSQASSGSSRRTSLASLSESAEFAAERSEDDGKMFISLHTVSYYLKLKNRFKKKFLFIWVFMLCRPIKPASSKGHTKTNLLFKIFHCQPAGAE